MTKTESLRSLEGLLESFLGKAVSSKESQLSVLSGLSRLDEISRLDSEKVDVAGKIGDWLAEHGDWLSGNEILPDDADRIKSILGNVSREMECSSPESKEAKKIQSEIERWQKELGKETKKDIPATIPGQKIVLHRGPETRDTPDRGSVRAFSNQLKSLLELWEGVSDRRPHILSGLDDLLKSAYLQQNREALLLSGFIIYYLRQNGYFVEPYVKRLKAAESLIKKGDQSG